MPSSAEQRCFAHDSDRQEELRRTRVAGGRARSTVARAGKHLPPHLQTLQRDLIALFADVKAEKVAAQAAAAASSIAGRLIDLARFSLEAGEAEALAQRLGQIEQQLRELAG